MDETRPKWCPHTNCKTLIAFDTMCIGKMKQQEKHDGFINDHRFCLCQFEGLPIDYQCNRGDIYILSRFFTQGLYIISDDPNNNYPKQMINEEE